MQQISALAHSDLSAGYRGASAKPRRSVPPADYTLRIWVEINGRRLPVPRHNTDAALALFDEYRTMNHRLNRLVESRD